MCAPLWIKYLFQINTVCYRLYSLFLVVLMMKMLSLYSLSLSHWNSIHSRYSGFSYGFTNISYWIVIVLTFRFGEIDRDGHISFFLVHHYISSFSFTRTLRLFLNQTKDDLGFTLPGHFCTRTPFLIHITQFCENMFFNVSVVRILLWVVCGKEIKPIFWLEDCYFTCVRIKELKSAQ